MYRSRIAVCLFAVIFALPSVADAQRDQRGTDSKQVSFINDVAPLINSKCGKCHVSGSKGEYDINSYEALMESDSIIPQKPDESYFIEIIENGEMPKGGLKVDKTELETLKQWIAQGAKFDGEDESQAINNGGSGNAQGNARSRGARSQSARSQSRSGGRRPSRARSRSNSGSNAIESNKLLAFLDTNGDGNLSLAEIDAASRMLFTLDKNKDGRLTVDEFQEFGDK